MGRTQISRARPPRAGLLTAGLCGSAPAAYVLLWLRLGHEEAAGSDFSASYVAAQGWRGGTGLYDQAAQLALHRGLLPGFRIDLPFITPPTTALLAAPSTLLGVDAAFRVMSALALLLVIASVALVLRDTHPARGGRRSAIETAAPALAALAGVGSCVVLWQGQWDGLCALGLAGAYVAWRHDHRLLAGAVLAAGFGATKPHLAVGLVLFLLATRDRRAITGMLAGAGAVLLAGLAAGGPRAWVDWLGALSLSNTHSPVASLVGYTGLAGSWLGDTGTARALAAAASVAAVAACAILGDRVRRAPGRFPTALAGAVVLSLVAAPHLLPHDLSILAPVAAWMLAGAAGTERMRAVALIWTAINAAALLDLGNASVGPPGRLVPLALTLAGAAALRATRPAPETAEAPAYSSMGSGLGGVVDQS